MFGFFSLCAVGACASPVLTSPPLFQCSLDRAIIKYLLSHSFGEASAPLRCETDLGMLRITTERCLCPIRACPVWTTLPLSLTGSCLHRISRFPQL